MSARIDTTLLACLAASIVLSAQEPVPPFQTEVNYVRVDMYPTRNGEPVMDLAAEDIEILEDGVPQKIDKFEHMTFARSRAQSPLLDPSSMSDMKRALADPRARVFVIFLDPRHVSTFGAMQVRKPMIDAIDALMGDNDLLAVMTPEMDAHGLTFSRHTTSVESILSSYWEAGRLARVDPEEVEYEACYGPRVPYAAEMAARRREVKVLDALESLIEYLGPVREDRKSVITLSGGWELYGPNPKLAGAADPDQPSAMPHVVTDPRTGKPIMSNNLPSMGSNFTKCENDRVKYASIDDQQRFYHLMQRANRLNVSFYPIDPSGYSRSYTPNNTQINALKSMADMTMGSAVVNPNSMTADLSRVVDQLSSYYLAGYYSTGKPDGQFHKITVRVKRPGVQVRARPGFLAPAGPPPGMTTAAPKSPAEQAQLKLIAAALGYLEAQTRSAAPRPMPGGVELFRRGPTTGLREEPTMDPQFRRTERIIVEMPTKSADDTFSARFLDRTGRPMSIAVKSSVHDIAPGSRRRRVEVTLAPLAPGDYLIEMPTDDGTQLVAFRLVP